MIFLQLLGPALALVNTPFPVNRLKRLESDLDVLNATTAIIASSISNLNAQLDALIPSPSPPLPPVSPPPPEWQICAVLRHINDGTKMLGLPSGQQEEVSWLGNSWSTVSGDFNFLNADGTVNHYGNNCPSLSPPFDLRVRKHV